MLDTIPHGLKCLVSYARRSGVRKSNGSYFLLLREEEQFVFKMLFLGIISFLKGYMLNLNYRLEEQLTKKESVDRGLSFISPTPPSSCLLIHLWSQKAWGCFFCSFAYTCILNMRGLHTAIYRVLYDGVLKEYLETDG